MVTENGIQSDGNTSFLRAARAGNLDKVLEHLKNNVDINTSNANGLNALHLAAKDGHVHVVAELLKRGAIVDNATKKGNTALHIASLAGQEDVVKLLLQHSASVNAQSQNGFTPLYMAAQENHDSVVKLLLSNGANQSLATEDGFTPLAVAMQQGHDKVVAVLLESDTRGKVRLPALHIAAKKDDVKAATLLLENDHNPDVTSKSGFTPLHIASHYGNESIANLLIQKGADVNFAAKHNITPLHVTAKWGKTNMVSLLLEKGANIESKTRDGLTPLHCAARSGHEQVVDMLLERGAPISAKTKNGLAPLHMAAQGEHVDAARILLYHRAPVDEVTVDYLTALHVAAHCGHVRVAKLLLDRNADANARALNGFTPLHIACKKNRIKVVELLLKHGASISATTESGLTPLHVASFMGCMNIVIYLLQHEASPDVPTVRGETPLHLAARANQTDIIRILLRNGAQVDARAREQQTPLHIASRLGNVDIVMLLLQHGAQVDATTKDMYTALHIAAKEGQDEVAGVLIENQASLDATTKKGFTPLHLAAKYGHIKVAELLLQKDAPVDAQGKNGVTPLHVASHYDHQDVALLLLSKGASPHSIAKNGHTPLHIAARKNQMDIATTLLEYGAVAGCESKAGFTPLHLSAQEGHAEMSGLLLEHNASANHQARNGLAPMHLCAQDDRVNVAQLLVKHGADIETVTKAGYTPLHVASHFGQANMVRFLQQNGANVNAKTSIDYTPMHHGSQQGHSHIVNLLLENKADPNALTANGQTPLNIAHKLGYISVLETLKNVTEQKSSPMQTSMNDGEKYRVVAPELMHETFMSDSEEEGGDDNAADHPYRYLTVDEMKSLGDDSLPIDVTRDERMDSNRMVQSTDSSNMPPTAIEDAISPQHASAFHAERSVVDSNYIVDNIKIDKQQHLGKLHWKNFLVSFLVDARGGAMRGCRHSGIRIIVPARSAAQPTRITCRYMKPQRTLHPPQLMEGEALASRVLELGPVGAKFLGPVVMEVPHFASLRGKEREIVILRSDNGETWREHSVDNSDEIVHDILNDCFEPEDLSQMDDLAGGRICRFVTYDFPQYFAVVSRIRQEVHAIGPEGGMVSSTVVPQVQAVFPQGALTKKIKVGLQAQPIDADLTAKLLGRGVAVSPIVTVEPRRRKFHKAITLSMPAPKAHSQGMINQYLGNAPTLRLLCSITGGPSRAQWEDVTGSTPLTFVNDCVSFTTTVSARFWLMDCRNVADATKMATELYREAINVPFMAKFVIFAKRVDPMEARLRVFCMTDDKEDKTLESQENFTEVAKSRDVEVLEGKLQYTELAGNLIPVTKSGEQLQFPFKAFRENRLPFSVRVKDQHADTVGRALFMREPRVAKGEQPQQPICILNIVLPEKILPDHISVMNENRDVITRIDISRMHKSPTDDYNYLGDLRIVDISNLLGEDWVRLAPEIGITQAEINSIKEKNPTSTARQAQSMLRIYQSRKQSGRNKLEYGLKTISRDDIIPKCIKLTSYIDKNGRKTTSIDNGYEEQDIMKDSESVEELVFQEDNRLQQLREREELKYSAEEKIVEDSESEEDETIKKSVAERREQIQKRLSIERQIPASSQKKEIVQEITEIKRRSIIEDKRALHEEEIIMQAPVDKIIKPSAIPEPITKLKSTRKDGSTDISKTEFDKELQTKFKTSMKDMEDFEHTEQTVMFESIEDITDKKIQYDSTITEKSFKDIEDPISKDYQTEKDKKHFTSTMDNRLSQDSHIKKKDGGVTTIRFLEQEIESNSGDKKSLDNLIDPELAAKLSVQKEKIVDGVNTEKDILSPKVEKPSEVLIDPQLAAKLSVQKDKIADFVEPEIEIMSPVKCEMKKTISSDQIDLELSAKLQKQKEKADRIVEDDARKSPLQERSLPTGKIESATFIQKESTQSLKETSETHKTQSVKIISDKTDNVHDQINVHHQIDNLVSTSEQTDYKETEMLKHFDDGKNVTEEKLSGTDFKTTVKFLEEETEMLVKSKIKDPIAKTATKSENIKSAEEKSSTGPFSSETDSDEFYKTIQEKITKKLSQDYTAMQQEITFAASQDIVTSQTPPPTPNELQQQQSQESREHIQDEETTDKTEVVNRRSEDVDSTKEPGCHSAQIDIIPKPSPRLTKPITNDDNSSATNQDTPITYSRQVTKNIAETDIIQPDDDDLDPKCDSPNQVKDSWQTVETAIESNKGPPPVAKPRSVAAASSTVVGAQDSFEVNSVKDLSLKDLSLKDLSLESSNISSEQQVEYSNTQSRSNFSDNKYDLKDDDSCAIEDKLEDESYPISDNNSLYDLKCKDQKGYAYSKDDSFEFDLIRDKDTNVDISGTAMDDFSIYKTKEREDILDLDFQDDVPSKAITNDLDEITVDTEEQQKTKRKTSFYIGESSIDVIVKTAEQKLMEADEKDELDFTYDSEMPIDSMKINKEKESVIETKSEVVSEHISEHSNISTEKVDIIYTAIDPVNTVTEYESMSMHDRAVEALTAKESYSTASSILVHPEETQQTYDISESHKINETKTKLELKLEKNETAQFSNISSDSEYLSEAFSDSTQKVHKVTHSPVQQYESTSKMENIYLTDTATKLMTSHFSEVSSSIQSELEKINESFADVQSDRNKIDQTFAEVQESLKAVNEDLIEVVKDGRQIKESPSEFEFKILPNIKYPQLESHEEEIPHLPTVTDKSKAQVKMEIVTTKPETTSIAEPFSISPKPDGEHSSNDDSLSKLDVVHRTAKSTKQTTNRWSVSDPDNYSSSGSHYESFERTDSRPCSSDVENLYTTYGGNSSEYQTAGDASSLIPGSTEYHTAASTLDHSGKTISSHESMKSFDSESSGHLGSIEVSEASETLVPSTMDIDLPSDSVHDLEMDENEMKLASLEACGGVLLENFEDDNIISPSMKRSQEMIFDPYRSSSQAVEIIEKNILTERHIDNESNKYGSLEECRFATSLEDGSILSQSLSSTSNVETIVENLKDEMGSSFGSSLVGSYEMQSLIRDDITGTSFEDPDFIGGRIDNMVMTTSIVKEDDVTSVNTQITTTMEQQPPKRTKGHKRNDSTSFLKGLEASKQTVVDISLDEEMIDHEEGEQESDGTEYHREGNLGRGGGGGDGGTGNESDSDYDRYETEYSRSFKQPTKQGKKKSAVEKSEEKAEIEKIERKISIPSVETIVEDVMAEVETESNLERAVSQNMLDYSNIPDIMITDDPTKQDTEELDDDVHEEMDIPVAKEQKPREMASTSPIQYAHESEIRITEEEYQEMIDKQYKSKIADVTTKFDYEDDDNKGDSPTDDSFEMLEQPDIVDEFVIIEEVAKEANEFDTEGKSVTIQNIKYAKKHDEDVETLLVKSAPAATNEGSTIFKGHAELGFDFEDSPPADQSDGNAYEPNGLDSSRKWVEMQLAEQAQNLRYPYDMERGVLEDIKEEDTDMEVGSSRISSFKDSFSSTPEYDVLAGRKYFAKEHDDMSVNSLQEFESLEQAISLENRKFHQGSQDSLSNGSFTKRYLAKSAGGQGDDISLSSLKEFEGLENACLEAHLIEIRAKEEAALLLSRSDESNNSDKASKHSPKMTTVMTTKTTVLTKSPGAPVTTVVEERKTTTTTTSGFHSTTRTLEEIDDNMMEVSSDSLEMGTKVKPSQSKDTSHYGSTDSLELNKSGNDIMTSSIDSMEIAAKEGGVTARSSRSDADSLEQLLLAGRGEMNRRDSIDSIEMQYALLAQSQAGGAYPYDRDTMEGNTKYDSVVTSGQSTMQSTTITTTRSASITYGDGMTKDISNDSLNINQSEPELLLTSTESLDRSSSTATNATYQNANDSQMSGSITSCGSNTLIDTLESQYTDMYDGSSIGFSERQPSTSSTSTGSTVVSTVVHRTQTKDGEKVYDYFEFNDPKGDVADESERPKKE